MGLKGRGGPRTELEHPGSLPLLSRVLAGSWGLSPPLPKRHPPVCKMCRRQGSPGAAGVTEALRTASFCKDRPVGAEHGGPCLHGVSHLTWPVYENGSFLLTQGTEEDTEACQDGRHGHEVQSWESG